MKYILCLFALVFFVSVNSFAFMEKESFDDYHFFLKCYLAPSFGLSGGDLLDTEKKLSFTILYVDGTQKTGNPNVTQSLGWGLGAEVVFFRFGLFVNYQPIVINEDISIGGDGYKTASGSGKFFDMNNFLAGINYYVPIEFSPYFLAIYGGVGGGTIWGTFKPFPSIQSVINQYFGSINESTTVSGYNISPRIGINFIYSMFMAGVAFTYDYEILTLGKNLSEYYTELSGTRFTLSRYTIDLTVGLAF